MSGTKPRAALITISMEANCLCVCFNSSSSPFRKPPLTWSIRKDHLLVSKLRFGNDISSAASTKHVEPNESVKTLERTLTLSRCSLRADDTYSPISQLCLFIGGVTRRWTEQWGDTRSQKPPRMLKVKAEVQQKVPRSVFKSSQWFI